MSVASDATLWRTLSETDAKPKPRGKVRHETLPVGAGRGTSQHTNDLRGRVARGGLAKGEVNVTKR